MLSIPFQHGRIQIGRFDLVYHRVDGWSGGRRGKFNFSVKKIEETFSFTSQSVLQSICECPVSKQNVCCYLN